MMKKLTRIATPLIAVALMGGAPLFAHAQNQQAPTTESQSWNTPPAGTEQEQAAYRDGVQSALADKLANRKVDAKSSNLYVHPPVKKQSRDAYRASFVAGYEAAVKHSSGE
jgi:hypothetical protein